MALKYMQFGSTSPAMGGADPLQEAIARRATGQAGITQQQTPSAPGFDPTTQTPSVPPTGGQPTGAPPSPPMPIDSAEAKMIIQSLTGRLKHDSKMKERGGM